jgi:hypothetical protein
MSSLNHLKNAAQRAHKAVSSVVEANTKRVIDGALDVKDNTLGGVAKGIGNSWGAASEIVNFPVIGELIGMGVSIGLLAAPVPVGVGLGILWLFDSQIKERQGQIEALVEDSKKRRKHERVVGLLKKYGEIPETAILETSLIRIELNSKTGQISGCVLTGDFKNTRIEDIDHHGLFQLIQSCNDDPESRQILEAIENIRTKSLKEIFE